MWLQEYYLQVLATPREEGAFVDLLAPEDDNPKNDEQRRLDRRNSVGRNTPARFVQRMVVRFLAACLLFVHH